MSQSANSFGSQTSLESGKKTYEIYRLNALEKKGVNLSRLPYSLRILLENLLRHEDGKSVTAEDIEFLAKWEPVWAEDELTRGAFRRRKPAHRGVYQQFTRAVRRAR